MHYLPKIKALDHRNLNWEKAMRRGTLLTENKKYIVHYCERQPWAANKKIHWAWRLGGSRKGKK